MTASALAQPRISKGRGTIDPVREGQHRSSIKSRIASMFDIASGTLVTYNPKAVTPDTPLDELERIMRELQVRHLPVIDEQHNIVGLVSERDLARARYND